MFGGEPVVERKCAGARRTAGLCDEPPVTGQAARTIASAVKVEEHPVLSAARSKRPLGRDATSIGRFEFDVVRDRPDRTDRLDPFASFGPSNGPRSGSKQLSDRSNLFGISVLAHQLCSA
jgi:hypothetical protein